MKKSISMFAVFAVLALSTQSFANDAAKHPAPEASPAAGAAMSGEAPAEHADAKAADHKKGHPAPAKGKKDAKKPAAH